jgi:hypothetical protein
MVVEVAVGNRKFGIMLATFTTAGVNVGQLNWVIVVADSVTVVLIYLTYAASASDIPPGKRSSPVHVRSLSSE